MSFDWNEYLNIAKSLKAETDAETDCMLVEAKRRAAISRAYYAVYHIAEDYASLYLNYVPTNSGGGNSYHADLRGIYRRQFGNIGHQEIQKMLARLHKARKDSDYTSDSASLGNVQKLLTSVILEADEIKKILNS